MGSRRDTEDIRTNPIGWLKNQLMTWGLERFCKRFYGIYRGIVIDNEDPESRGRCRIQVPSIGQHTEDDVPASYWARPSMTGLSVGEGQMHGCFFPPDVKDEVWVQFENGDTKFPVYTGGFMKTEYEGDDLIAEKALYKGIRTKSGNYIRLSDDKDNDDVHITIAKGDGDGSVSGSTISLMANGSVVILNDDGSNIYLDKENKAINLMTSDGSEMLSSVSAGDDKISMITKSGGSLSITGDIVEFNCKDFIVNSGGKIALLSGKVFAGKGVAYEPAVRGQRLNIWALAHQHTVTFPGNPTAPFPVPPGLMMMNELSEIVSIA